MGTLAIDNIILSEKDFRKISDMVYEHCGINLHEGKKELVRARLAKQLRLGKFNTFPEYMEHVFDDETGKEFSILIDALSTNLTSFFRERQHFDFLKDTFLPALLDRKQKNRNFRLRCWSAGCSSGEEPYSIAITLLEAVQGQGRWNVKVLATDISASMLETAKKGVYNEGRVEPVPSLQKSRYLTSSAVNKRKVYEVSNLLRELVIFKYLNLMEDWPIEGPVDFIFCRNVMIYFDKSTQQKLVGRYWDLLEPGGILFTGHSESLTGIEHKFKYVQPTIYMKP